MREVRPGRDRAAVVTGGTSGVGLAVARMLGSAGYSLTLMGRDPARLQAAAGELGLPPERVNTHAGDLSQEDTAIAAVASHRDRFRRLDVLVNSAGVSFRQAVADLTSKKFDLQVAINLRASMLMCREASEMLVAAGSEHKRAVVVNIASIAAYDGIPGYAAYSATKAGLVAFTQAWNGELGARGVRATVISPTFVATPMVQGLGLNESELIAADDIAEVVRMLLCVSPNCLAGEVVLTPPGGK